MPIGGIGGILAGELWGFFFGEVRDGLDIFLYGDWGYVTGTTIGGVVGLAIVVKAVACNKAVPMISSVRTHRCSARHPIFRRAGRQTGDIRRAP